jgi:hypothetical protein
MYRFAFILESKDRDQSQSVNWLEANATRLVNAVQQGKYKWLQNLDPYRARRVTGSDLGGWRSDLEQIRAAHIASMNARDRRGTRSSPTQDSFSQMLQQTIALFSLAENNSGSIRIYVP